MQDNRLGLLTSHAHIDMHSARQAEEMKDLCLRGYGLDAEIVTVVDCIENPDRRDLQGLAEHHQAKPGDLGLTVYLGLQAADQSIQDRLAGLRRMCFCHPGTSVEVERVIGYSREWNATWSDWLMSDLSFPLGGFVGVTPVAAPRYEYHIWLVKQGRNITCASFMEQLLGAGIRVGTLFDFGEEFWTTVFCDGPVRGDAEDDFRKFLVLGLGGDCGLLVEQIIGIEHN